MKTPIEWYRELYQHGSGALDGTADIVAIQADALGDLRDRFACAALTGLLASADAETRAAYLNGYLGAVALTNFAYTCADAMMVRRAQQTGAPAPAPAPFSEAHG